MKGRRAYLYRQRRPDGTWSSWNLATLGIPSLLAKGKDRDDYEVAELIDVQDVAAHVAERKEAWLVGPLDEGEFPEAIDEALWSVVGMTEHDENCGVPHPADPSGAGDPGCTCGHDTRVQRLQDAIGTCISEVRSDAVARAGGWLCEGCGAIAPPESDGWIKTPDDDAGVSVEWCPACHPDPS